MKEGIFSDPKKMSMDIDDFPNAKHYDEMREMSQTGS